MDIEHKFDALINHDEPKAQAQLEGGASPIRPSTEGRRILLTGQTRPIRRAGAMGQSRSGAPSGKSGRYGRASSTARAKERRASSRRR